MPEVKGLGDVQVGIRMREAIKRITTAVVNEIRPEDRIGKVFSVDQVTQTAKILFPGETTGSLVTAHFATNMQPRTVMLTNFGTQGYAAPCDVVRVSGKPGSYWISEFISGKPLSTASRLQNVGSAAIVSFATTNIPNNNVLYTTHQFFGVVWPAEADVAFFMFNVSCNGPASTAGYIRPYATNAAGSLVELGAYRVHNLGVASADIGVTFSYTLNANLYRNAGGYFNLEIRMQNDTTSAGTITVGPGNLTCSFLGVD